MQRPYIFVFDGVGDLFRPQRRVLLAQLSSRSCAHIYISDEFFRGLRERAKTIETRLTAMTRRDVIVNPIAALMVGRPVVCFLRERGQTNDSMAPPSVTVLVVDSVTRKRVANARVFVFAKNGGMLAEVHTDGAGMASLPSIAPEHEPQYVFAEAQWSFVVGREWLPGQIEYYMPLSPLTPPGFTG